MPFVAAYIYNKNRARKMFTCHFDLKLSNSEVRQRGGTDVFDRNFTKVGLPFSWPVLRAFDL